MSAHATSGMSARLAAESDSGTSASSSHPLVLSHSSSAALLGGAARSIFATSRVKRSCLILCRAMHCVTARQHTVS